MCYLWLWRGRQDVLPVGVALDRSGQASSAHLVSMSSVGPDLGIPDIGWLLGTWLDVFKNQAIYDGLRASSM